MNPDRPAHQPPQRPLGGLAGWLVLAGVLTQISYPLTTGTGSVVVTVISVLLLSAAACTHVLALTGSAAMAGVLLGVTAGTGWLAEVIGIHTGVPFGSYRYTSLLGPPVLGVPVLVPLAWTMLAYPCLLLGRQLSGSAQQAPGSAQRLPPRWRTAVLGGLALASWDLFLDPQMVALGAWTWQHPRPGLPGVTGVPLTNYAGWLIVSVILIAVADRAMDAAETGPPARSSKRLRLLTPAQQQVPAAVLAWTWLGSLTGNLVFFDRPAVALYAGIAMGALTLPYLRLLWQGRHTTETVGAVISR